MRQGIRDVLVVLSVVVGGLAISSTIVSADDPQPTSEAAATEEPAATSETPSAETPTAADDQKAAPDEAAKKSDDEAAKRTEPAAKDAHKKGGQAAAGGEEHTDEKGHVDGDDSGGEHVGDDHASHDPFDLSHQNASPAIGDPSQFRSELAIWTMVVFLCLLALLVKFAWGPIMEGLERREASIAAAIDEAEQAAAKGAEQLKLYEAKLAAAADETREILAQARKDAEAASDRIVAEAKDAATRERDKAVADITAAKNSALTEITERSVDLAVTMAGRMIQRQLTPDDRAGLIREALDQLPNQN